MHSAPTSLFRVSMKVGGRGMTTASVPVAGFPENEFPCKVSLSIAVACQPKAPPGDLVRDSWLHVI